VYETSTDFVPSPLQLYGTNDPAIRDNLTNQMRRDKLPVGHAADRRRKEAAAARQRERQEAAVAKERERRAKEAAKRAKMQNAKRQAAAAVGAGGGQATQNSMAEFAAGSQSQDITPGPSMEDIIGGSERFNPRNVEQVVEDFGVKESDLAAMPQASQPAAMLSNLHPFQLQGQ
jgi:SWI/SNF-related matrix-associated actin-dependent regulator of chromatin subfamily A3